MHTSIKLDTPIEFVNVTPLNSLISKCQIKVCYVGEDPNRNGSVITREVAKQMANSLPGCPIVGFYNEEKKDFEEHNRIIDISNGNFEIKDVTRPYGFVDLGAKVWFQKFLDDNKDEREYLMTEGWLWTSQYPDCQRVIAHSNNQSMELDPDTLKGTWAESDKDEPSFFIINEAMISKLCILGEENEPCFEGANISAPTIQFSFEKSFKEQLFSMMNELKELLNEGGKKVYTRYAVEIGDNIWNALYAHVKDTYSIESVCVDNEQKFAVLISDNKYYRLNFSVAENGDIAFEETVTAIDDYTPNEEPQFDAAAVQEYAASLNVEPAAEPATVTDSPESEEPAVTPAEPENIPENQDRVGQYNLDDIQEYVELNNKYSALENQLNTANDTIASLNAQISELTQFKKNIEKAEKQKMIDSFYMLSDEDKSDVVENIDTYSLDDIEAKLSIICVRNRVSFNLDEDKEKNQNSSLTFNLNDGLADEAPAWVKALRSVAKEKDI